MMYVTLTDVQNGQSFALGGHLHNENGALKIALCEITYYPRWANISEALGNNTLMVGGQIHTIPPGYHNVCSLNEWSQDRLAGIELYTPTGCLMVKGGKDLTTLPRATAVTLGFSDTTTIQAGEIAIAPRHPRFAIHRELQVHLDEISTTDNVLNDALSTLLRLVPVESEKSGSGRTVSFTTLQPKRLASGDIGRLTVRVLDAKGKPMDLSYLSLVLLIT